MKHTIIRAEGSGCWAGELKEYDRANRAAVLINARRLYYWDGAATLSELATRGTSKPDNCKFPQEVSQVEVSNVLEVIDMTDVAIENIKAVPVWTA